MLVLDALNQLDDASAGSSGFVPSQLAWLPKQMPHGVRLVVSTLPGTALSVIRQQRPTWPTMSVAPLSADERLELVRQFSRHSSKSFSAEQRERLVSCRMSENPLFLRTVLEELRVFGSFEQLDTRIAWYLEADSVPALFNKVFERMEQQFEHSGTVPNGTIGSLLALIYVSHRGLSESELLEILHLTYAQWCPIYLSLDQSLVSRSGLLTFFHDYMRQAVYLRYLSSAARALSYHQQLANFFDARFRDASQYQQQQQQQQQQQPPPPRDDTIEAATTTTPSEAGDVDASNDAICAAVDSRIVDELPFHLLASRQHSRLASIITSAPMFFKLCSPQYKFELFRYWRELQSFSPHQTLLNTVLQLTPSSRGSLASTAKQYCKYLVIAGKFLEDMAVYDGAERLYLAALQARSDQQDTDTAKILYDPRKHTHTHTHTCMNTH